MTIDESVRAAIEANAPYYAGTRPELRPFIPAHHRVLEVGCGRGGFRSNLAPDAEVWGIEMVPDVAQQARGVLHRVLVGRFADVEAQLPQSYFDLVICNDVIEHMPDDREFLLSLRRYIAPGGSLMGSIPNMRHWPVLRGLVLNKEWEYVEQGILDRTHLRFYTVKSFPRLLEETGYTVVRFAGINRAIKLWTRRFLSLFFWNWASDLFYIQFAFVARPKTTASPEMRNPVSKSV